MYTKRIEPLQSRILIALLLFTVFPICGFGKKKNVPPPVMDSIQAARFIGLDPPFVFVRGRFYYRPYREDLIYPAAGAMSDEEWNRRAAIVRDKAVHANNRWGYVYACRYLNLLKDDAHFKFPDEGMFNREGFFTENDSVFPLWVQTWKDGTVYNVKDYTGVVPPHAPEFKRQRSFGSGNGVWRTDP